MPTVAARLRALVLVASMLLAGCAVINPAAEINALMAEGQQLYSAQRFDEAIARFRAVTARDPYHYLAHVWLARSFAARGNWLDAIVNARRAFELNPGAPDVMAVLLDMLLGGGTDALMRGNFSESIGLLTEYLRHQPGNIRAWLNVGKAYVGNRQFLDALKAFRTALDGAASATERSEIIQSLLAAGRQAFNQREYGAASSLLREYLRVNPGERSVLDMLKLLPAR